MTAVTGRAKAILATAAARRTTDVFVNFQLSKSHNISHKPKVCKFRVREKPTDTITVMTPVAQ